MAKKEKEKVEPTSTDVEATPPIEESAEVTEEEIVIPKGTKKKVKTPKPLSTAALKWQAYLRKMTWTPEQYLSRYPEHKYREIIEEILAQEKNK